ncbi:MAG: 16S rRNA (guanine(527)-N(7))-methyltransferase RsmG [Thalassovita sp.]
MLPFDVSRETMDRLEVYADLLKKWNPKINLVSKATLADLWTRHIVDSAQIYTLAPKNFTHWSDLGSGGGFPGLVCAIIAAERNPTANFTLIESDARKSVFLRTVARETGIKVNVFTDRIERAIPLNADILSARALADLTMLLSFADLHLQESGIALFPKGVNWQKEVEEARKAWFFEYEAITSETESGSIILRIGDISRV